MNLDRTETLIRENLIRHLQQQEASDTAFISELFIDNFSRRADLIVANGRLAAFEIKSRSDNLSRLSGQLSVYQDFFEQVTIVCAENHLDNVLKIAPKSVSVWEVTPDGSIKKQRQSKRKKALPKKNWLSFLPVIELRKLLKELHNYPTKGNRLDLVKLAENIPVSEIKQYVLLYLKRRHLRINELKDKQRTEKIKALTNQNIINEIAAKKTTLTAIPRKITRI